MEEILLKLKRLLNSIDDEELKEMELWIDNESSVDIIAIENNSISLITDSKDLSINGKGW